MRGVYKGRDQEQHMIASTRPSTGDTADVQRRAGDGDGIGIAIIFTMVSITMLERKQEIATMLTLGSRPWAVGRSFLIETTAIALGILPVGIVLGWALCWVLINKVLSSTTTQLAPELSFPLTPWRSSPFRS